jgi:hypothetical protein
MRIPKAEEIHDFLYNKEKGFLIKYHFKQGLDLNQLDELYEILECLKDDWKNKTELPKSILFHIITITPVLYRDLQLYSSDEVVHCQYEELIDNLERAIQMCLNPDINDMHFNKPLKELNF